MIYFPMFFGERKFKEPQNLPNHRVVGQWLNFQLCWDYIYLVGKRNFNLLFFRVPLAKRVVVGNGRFLWPVFFLPVSNFRITPQNVHQSGA